MTAFHPYHIASCFLQISHEASGAGDVRGTRYLLDCNLHRDNAQGVVRSCTTGRPWRRGRARARVRAASSQPSLAPNPTLIRFAHNLLHSIIHPTGRRSFIITPCAHDYAHRLFITRHCPSHAIAAAHLYFPNIAIFDQVLVRHVNQGRPRRSPTQRRRVR